MSIFTFFPCSIVPSALQAHPLVRFFIVRPLCFMFHLCCFALHRLRPHQLNVCITCLKLSPTQAGSTLFACFTLTSTTLIHLSRHVMNNDTAPLHHLHHHHDNHPPMVPSALRSVCHRLLFHFFRSFVRVFHFFHIFYCSLLHFFYNILYDVSYIMAYAKPSYFYLKLVPFGVTPVRLCCVVRWSLVYSLSVVKHYDVVQRQG